MLSTMRRGRAPEKTLGENRDDGAEVCFVRVVQTGSKADRSFPSFPSDDSRGGDLGEDGVTGLMRDTIMRKYLSLIGNGVTGKVTKCK